VLLEADAGAVGEGEAAVLSPRIVGIAAEIAEIAFRAAESSASWLSKHHEIFVRIAQLYQAGISGFNLRRLEPSVSQS
jgi:hypothetical protein